MPIKCENDGWVEEMSFYAPLVEFTVSALALDHFFREVVEGNVPLTSDSTAWWERSVVRERVNRYSENWCVLFEQLARMRSRLHEQVPTGTVQIDENLRFTYTSQRRGTTHAMTWSHDGRD